MSDYRTEVIEAIRAADDALFYLNRAKNSLTSARNWGIYDMIGGGFFSTAIKRNKMSDSQMYMDDANVALRKLEHCRWPHLLTLVLSSFLFFSSSSSFCSFC